MPIRFTLAGWQMNLMMRERTLDRIENELVSGITRAVTRPPRSTAPQTAVLPTGPGRGPRGAPLKQILRRLLPIINREA